MLIGIMTVEMLVVHPLVAHWWPNVAAVLSVASAATIGWLIWSARSFRRLPVVLDDRDLTLRLGRLRTCRVPLHQVAGASGEPDAQLVNSRRTLNLALLSWPNIAVALSAPRRVGRRELDCVAHRLDDAPAFLAALHGRTGGAHG